MLAVQSCVASADAAAADLVWQSTLCIQGKQMAFLLYAIVRVVSNVQDGQRIWYMLHIHVASAYPFWVAESWGFHFDRYSKIWTAGDLAKRLAKSMSKDHRQPNALANGCLASPTIGDVMCCTIVMGSNGCF